MVTTSEVKVSRSMARALRLSTTLADPLLLAGHGIIGTLAGAFLGSKAEDALKNRKHHNQGSSGGSSYGKW